MKILFPNDDKLDVLVCEKCMTPIKVNLATSEDGDVDYHWCEKCVDYRTGEIL